MKRRHKRSGAGARRHPATESRAPRHALPTSPRSEPISLAEAERALGWPAQGRGLKLRRYVLAREKQLGKIGAILVAIGVGRKRRERLTLQSLRRYCPELWPSKADDLAKNLRDYLRSIDDRVSESFADQVAEHLEPRLAELFDRQAKLDKRLRALGG